MVPSQGKVRASSCPAVACSGLKLITSSRVRLMVAAGCIGAECGISSLDSATLPLWSDMPCESKVDRGALNCCPWVLGWLKGETKLCNIFDNAPHLDYTAGSRNEAVLTTDHYNNITCIINNKYAVN